MLCAIPALIKALSCPSDTAGALRSFEGLALLQAFQGNLGAARATFQKGAAAHQPTSRFLRGWALLEKRQGCFEARMLDLSGPVSPSCLSRGDTYQGPSQISHFGVSTSDNECWHLRYATALTLSWGVLVELTLHSRRGVSLDVSAGGGGSVQVVVARQPVG